MAIPTPTLWNLMVLEINFLKMYFDAIRFAQNTCIFWRSMRGHWNCCTWLRLTRVYYLSCFPAHGLKLKLEGRGLRIATLRIREVGWKIWKLTFWIPTHTKYIKIYQHDIEPHEINAHEPNKESYQHPCSSKFFPGNSLRPSSRGHTNCPGCRGEVNVGMQRFMKLPKTWWKKGWSKKYFPRFVSFSCGFRAKLFPLKRRRPWCCWTKRPKNCSPRHEKMDGQWWTPWRLWRHDKW